MMTQPAGAAAAAHQSAAGLNGTATDGARAGGAEIICTTATTTVSAAAFSQTLQALAAGPDGEAAAQPGAVAADTPDTKSPPQDAIVLPQEWLLASTAAEQGASAQPGACNQPGKPAPLPAAVDPQTTQPAGKDQSAGAAASPSSTRLRTASARQPAIVADSKNCPRTKSAAPALQKDLARALFAKSSARPAQTGAVDSDAVAGDANAIQISTSVPIPAPLPTPEQTQAMGSGAALLAAVLQWLQPARGDASDAGSSTPTANGGQLSDADPMSVTGAVTAAASADAKTTATTAAAVNASVNPTAVTTAASGQSAPTPAAGSRQDLVAAVAGKSGAPPATLPAAPLVSPLIFQREPRAQTTGDDAARQPRDLANADLTAGNLSMAAALRATSAANPAQPEHSVAVPVHDRHWPTAMAAQVLILSSDKVRTATLRLSPEHLGPVEVHIDMQDSNVNVNFTAAHAETRAALEQAMPQLRNVLAGAGLTLGQATVQQQARRESQNPGALPRTGNATEPPLETPVTVVARALGMIDEYV